MEPSSPNTRTNENIDDGISNGKNPFIDSEAKSGVKGPGLPSPFGNFRISRKSKSVKKSSDTELESLPEKSVVGSDHNVEDQIKGTNPFEDPEPKAKSPDHPNHFGDSRNSKKSVKKSSDNELESIPEKSVVGKDHKVEDQIKGSNPFEDPEPKAKSPGLPNPFGNFRISKKSPRNQNEGKLQDSSERKSTCRKDYKDQEENDGTNPFEEPEPQAGEKRQSLSNHFGNFRISKKSVKKSNDTNGKDNKIQAEASNPFEEPESKVGEKSQGLHIAFGNFRISKKASNKPHEEEEQVSPEKRSPGGLQIKSSKKVLKRQSQMEEMNSPDKKEPFGQLGARLSKIYHKKHEHAEDSNSPDKRESFGVSTSLVTKLKTSMKSKKKIDFSEQEDNRTEEPKQEDKMDVVVVEEDKLLSVMEINELIHSRQLQKAFRSIVFMESKLKEESQGDNYYGNITEFTIRAKDVDLLHASLFGMIRSIVKETLVQEMDEALVAAVVYVLENEAINHENTSVPLGNSDIILCHPRRWKHLWKDVVKDSVAIRVESVPLNQTEESWLPKHLENLKNNTLQDLIKVKNSLMSLYPEEYKVCSTYLRSFHEALSSHIVKNVVIHATELSQLYSLLDFIFNKYKSEEFMGNPELQPEMNTAGLPPVLQGECLEKLEADYSTALEGLVQRYFQNILTLEKNKWEKEEAVEEDIFKELPLYTDIEHIIGTHVRESSRLSEKLEKSSFLICVEQLGLISKRLQEEFMEWSGSNFSLLSVQYSVVYINSLMKLRHNATQSDADQCRTAESNLKTAIEALKQHIFHLFATDTKPHFQKLITKKWLKKSLAFGTIIKSAKIMCQPVTCLADPHNKEMACRVHKYLVKEYIAQIMKRKISLNQLNRKKAAERMDEESNLFSSLADEMGSDRAGLYDVIQCISEIIGSKKKDEIKPKLEELYNLFPDISEEHILCILHVQGTGRSRKLLEHFHQLQKNHPLPSEPGDKLFSEIDCVSHVTCLSL